MFLEKETLDKFGYSIDSLPRTAKKKVVAKCDICGNIFERAFGLFGKTLNPGVHACVVKCQRAKLEEYCLRTYGVKDMSVRPGVQEKRRDTCLKKYGTTSPLQNEDVKNKIAKSNLEKYGVENVFASSEIKEQIKLTNLEKYGVERPTCNPVIFGKVKATCLKRFGTEYSFQAEEVKANIKKSNFEKYGVTNAMQNPDVRKRTEQTNLERYGVTTALVLQSSRDNLVAKNIEDYGKAYPKGISKAEDEVGVYLNSLGFEFKVDHSILSGCREIDYYCDELKLGVEYCGLYWHTENSPEPRDKKYHHRKYMECKAKGITLITIFEDEWLYSKEQVKNRLNSIVSKNSTRIFARKCEVRDLTRKEACFFIACNHIQKDSNLGIHFAGLFFENQLVGVMSFGRHPRKSNELVLDRLCFKSGVTIIGGASRLFKYLLDKTNILSIVSWSDNRWSSGEVYRQLGFTLQNELAPDYSYADVRHKKRLSKQSRKKKSIGCPENITEKEYNQSLGFSRIWDCGKKQWRYNK